MEDIFFPTISGKRALWVPRAAADALHSIIGMCIMDKNKQRPARQLPKKDIITLIVDQIDRMSAAAGCLKEKKAHHSS